MYTTRCWIGAIARECISRCVRSRREHDSSIRDDDMAKPRAVMFRGVGIFGGYKGIFFGHRRRVVYNVIIIFLCQNDIQQIKRSYEFQTFCCLKLYEI